ncbi:MAG: hypothetical protein ACI4VW_07025 [Acutalibacteraceae bacterium]
MNCKKCGNEIDKKAVVCPKCGCKVKKPIFKKWWFWVIIVLIIAIVGVSGGDTTTDDSATASSDVNTTAVSETVSMKTYEKVELQTMMNDLKDNALKAEKTYNNKYVELTGRIVNFDSNGSYISIESVNANDFNLDTVTCNINGQEQLDLLLEKSTGDVITLKCKVVSVGEVLGYTVRIEEIVE